MRPREAVVAAINKKADCNALKALTTAALVLPGLLSPIVYAADDDEMDFQYNHYQEGKRAIYGVVTDTQTGVKSVSSIKNALNPIEVDSLHGSGRLALTDRIKFAFNYLQDTWGGATPIATAPAVFGTNNPVTTPDGMTVVGASPLLQGSGQVYLNKQYQPLLLNTNPITGKPVYTKNNQLTHTMTMASPETRGQGDFRLTHEWDEAALSVGGGLSVEDDYESQFGNIGGRWDLNQKRTTLNLDQSYTNSQTNATLNHDTLAYITKDSYYLSHVETNEATGAEILTGNRQDWASHFGVTQVLNKNAIVGADVGYTRSTGYMANPYKAVNVVFIDPELQTNPPPFGYIGQLKAILEQRPDVRNQVNLGGRYVQYIEPLNAAFHFDYRFSTDDWGIHAHTFEADWVQPIGNGWTVTPRIRYYSQSAANFYTPYLVSNQGATSNIVDPVKGQAYTDGSGNGQLYFIKPSQVNGGGDIPVDGGGGDIPVDGGGGDIPVDGGGGDIPVDGGGGDIPVDGGGGDIPVDGGGGDIPVDGGGGDIPVDGGGGDIPVDGGGGDIPVDGGGGDIPVDGGGGDIPVDGGGGDIPVDGGGGDIPVDGGGGDIPVDGGGGDIPVDGGGGDIPVDDVVVDANGKVDNGSKYCQ